MYYRLILFSAILYLSSCKTSSIVSNTKYDNIKLSIESKDDKIVDFASLSIRLCNKGNRDFYIIKNEAITISENKAYTWRLEIVYNDSIKMLSPVYLLSKIGQITEDDYILVKSGDSYNFTYDFDFKELAIEPFDFNDVNKNYGEYSLKLIYEDKYNAKTNSLNEVVHSNTIKVNYSKE